MDEQQLNSEIVSLLTMPPYLTASSMVLDLLTAMLIFAAVIIIFTSSNRPGATLMLVGLAGAVLSYLPFFIDNGGLFKKTKFILFYLPLAGSAFLALSSLGFFKLALSFKSEG